MVTFETTIREAVVDEETIGVDVQGWRGIAATRRWGGWRLYEFMIAIELVRRLGTGQGQRTWPARRGRRGWGLRAWSWGGGRPGPCWPGFPGWAWGGGRPGWRPTPRKILQPPVLCIFNWFLNVCVFLWFVELPKEKSRSVQRRWNGDHTASLDPVLLVKDKPEGSEECTEDDPNQGGHHEVPRLERDLRVFWLKFPSSTDNEI